MSAALLLVDLQADYLAAAGLQPARHTLIARASEALAAARRQSFPVIHIWTTVERSNDRRLPHWKAAGRWACEAGTAGHCTPGSLTPRRDERRIQKSGFNGYADGQLDAALCAEACDTVLLAGLHLHTCVRTLAAESLERQRRVIVLEEAVATDDPILAAATRRWLQARGVEFLSTPAAFARGRGKTAPKLVHRSPRRSEEALFEVACADTAEISRATRTARVATAAWQRSTLAERAEIWERIALRLTESAPPLTRQMALELGKPIGHGREEVQRAAINIRDVLRRAAAFKFRTREPGGTVRYAPLGVIALISPWNNPVAIPLGKIAPALIYGNTVVWKPAPAATRLSKALLKLMHESGLPRGAVQLVTGDGQTAQRLAADPEIDAVTLTGAAAAGHAVQEICARRLLPFQAELSGNNAAIVWEDTDLPRAAALIASGAFGFGGQRCTANRRVVIQARIRDRFLRLLRRATAALRWGDPLEEDTDLGPLIHRGKVREQAELLAAARADGTIRHLCRPLAAQAKATWAQAGAYAEPVIVCCDDPAHPLVQEETMSPLLVVQSARDFPQALALCNGVRHGLVAALFSADPRRRREFAARAQAGILKFETSTVGADVTLPFSGWKTSGYGPAEHGVGDASFYTRIQTLYD